MAAVRATTGGSFQALILELQKFWAAQGCVVLQPYDVEVGAGTFHPATTLRALGPKPWKAAYVQPSRRPTDGRYGENPNRLQHYYQFQVILKPSPADSQDLYLASLAALGIDPTRHDIRFVEDDWESPTLGAWGLGWEVWCDGMEVTQFTYFQQVGGYDCKPVAGEQDLHNIEGLTAPGATVAVGVQRDGTAITLNTALKAIEVQTIKGDALDARIAGVQFTDIADSLRRQGIGGVSVSAIAESSRAWQAGLRKGDVIVAVNRRDLSGASDFKRLLALKPRQLMLTLLRGDEAFYLLLQ